MPDAAEKHTDKPRLLCPWCAEPYHPEELLQGRVPRHGDLDGRACPGTGREPLRGEETK